MTIKNWQNEEIKNYDPFHSPNGGIEWCLWDFSNIISIYGVDNLFKDLHGKCIEKINHEAEHLLKGLSKIDLDALKSNAASLKSALDELKYARHAHREIENILMEAKQSWQERSNLLNDQLKSWSQWKHDALCTENKKFYASFGLQNYQYLSRFWSPQLLLWSELKSYDDFNNNKNQFSKKFQDLSDFADQQYLKGNPANNLKWSNLQTALKNLQDNNTKILALEKTRTNKNKDLKSIEAECRSKCGIIFKQLQTISDSAKQALFRIYQAERNSQATTSLQSTDYV